MLNALRDTGGRCTVCSAPQTDSGGCLCAPTPAAKLAPCTCGTCEGRGGVVRKLRGFLQLFEQCVACGGRGWVWRAPGS